MKTLPCITSSASGFVMLPPHPSRALTIIKYDHADHRRACEAYRAANDLGERPVRPALQGFKCMMSLIEILEELNG